MLKRYLKGFDVIGVSDKAADMLKEYRKQTDVVQQLIKPDNDAYQKLLAQYWQDLISSRTTPQEFFQRHGLANPFNTKVMFQRYADFADSEETGSVIPFRIADT